MREIKNDNVPGGRIAADRVDSNFLNTYGDPSRTAALAFPEDAAAPMPSAPSIQPQPSANPSAQLTQGFRQQSGAIREQGRLESEQAKQLIPIAQQQEQAAADAYKESNLKRQAYTQYMTDAMTKYEQMNKEIQDTHLDPTRLLQGSRGMIASLGVALGTLGSSMSGGPNTALDIVNKAIDRDIEAQQLEYRKKQAGLSGQATLMDMARQQFGDESQALSATHALLTQRYAAALGTLAARMAPGIQLQKTKALEGQIQQLYGDRLMDMQNKSSEIATRHADEVMRRMTAMAKLSNPGAGSHVSASILEQIAAAKDALGYLDELEAKKFGSPTQPNLGTNPTPLPNSVGNAVEAMAGLIPGITTNREKYNALRNQAAQLVAYGFSGKTLRPQEVDFWREQMPGNETTTELSHSKFTSLRKKLKDKILNLTNVSQQTQYQGAQGLEAPIEEEPLE